MEPYKEDGAQNVAVNVLSKEKVRQLQAQNEQVRGYEYVFPPLPKDFKKLSMREVRQMIQKINRIGDKKKCLEHKDIRYFAEVSHPRIFKNLFEKDPVKKRKLMHQLEIMLNVMETIEEHPDMEEGLLRKLGNHMTGVDRLK